VGRRGSPTVDSQDLFTGHRRSAGLAAIATAVGLDATANDVSTPGQSQRRLLSRG